MLLNETSEIDLSGYATIASTVLRIGSRLGLQRRSVDVTPRQHDIISNDEVRSIRPILFSRT